MRIRQTSLIGICTAGVIMLSVVLLSNRPWSSAKDVENYVRKQTPLGSSAEDVRDFIRKRNWGTYLISKATLRQRVTTMVTPALSVFIYSVLSSQITGFHFAPIPKHTGDLM